MTTGSCVIRPQLYFWPHILLFSFFFNLGKPQGLLTPGTNQIPCCLKAFAFASPSEMFFQQITTCLLPHLSPSALCINVPSSVGLSRTTQFKTATPTSTHRQFLTSLPNFVCLIAPILSKKKYTLYILAILPVSPTSMYVPWEWAFLSSEPREVPGGVHVQLLFGEYWMNQGPNTDLEPR